MAGSSSLDELIVERPSNVPARGVRAGCSSSALLSARPEDLRRQLLLARQRFAEPRPDRGSPRGGRTIRRRPGSLHRSSAATRSCRRIRTARTSPSSAIRSLAADRPRRRRSGAMDSPGHADIVRLRLGKGRQLPVQPERLRNFDRPALGSLSPSARKKGAEGEPDQRRRARRRLCVRARGSTSLGSVELHRSLCCFTSCIT
jgi:hypothetical protein